MFDFTPEALQRQHGLERDMRTLGIERYRTAIANKDTSDTDPGLVLLMRGIAPLEAAIVALLEEAKTAKTGGRQYASAKYLRQVTPDVAAFIALKVTLDQAAGRVGVVSAAERIAAAIEDEARFRYFEAQDAKRFARLDDKLNKQTRNRKHKKRAMSALMGRREDVPKWTEWDLGAKRLLGLKMLELGAVTTKFFHLPRIPSGYVVELTPETMEYVEQRHAVCELLAPVLLPCIVPPARWTSIYGGGYYTRAVPSTPLIKSRVKAYLADMRNVEMPSVYEAVNALQNTAWRVNTRVLDVMLDVWGSAVPVGTALPSRVDQPLPDKPEDIATNEEARTDWKRKAAVIYGRNAKAFSRRLQVVRVLSIAERFREDTIWFPYQLDFRGRVYAVPGLLNPQGADYAKGLLTFANGKPLGDATAAGWLAIHTANCFGFDKVPLEDRIGWTEERNDRIAAVAADPMADLWWTEAEHPWQFLAACFEWAGFLREGYDFVSSLPIGLDGSCNGIQHFSAMLRDPVGGAAVNLVPSDRPADIYQRVADVVMEKLRLHSSTGADDDKRFAAGWLDFGIDRKIAKRPVMVLPYGGTLLSANRYVTDVVVEKIEAGKPNPFGEDLYKASGWLSSVLWKAIGDVVSGSREVMEWLQKAARIVAKEQLPITWRTPTGFVVQQAYREVEERRLQTVVSGSVMRLRINADTDAIDVRRQGSGIAPNFVHSMDASALVLSVGVALDNDIQSFHMVHDSYGTVAADTAKLGACLRHAFVDMYQTGDWLALFRDDLRAALSDAGRAALDKLDLPQKGALDIAQVLQSDFFFA